MRIIFFGEDSFSACVLESLINEHHKILAVFCPIYQNYTHARLKLICKKYNIQFHRINDINTEENESYIRKLKPDLISVCHFQKILKKNIIKIPVYGCINLHPSLLPNYRGLSPQHWPIINGDKETGITVHFINEEIDKGDIILQKRIAINPQMYVLDLQIEMLKTYKFIFKDAVALLTQKKLNPIPQNHLEGSYYGKLKEDQCNIDLNKGCINAYNLIRGVSEPYMGARLNGYRIWRANLSSKEVSKRIKTKYSENGIYFDESYGALIKFSDGSLIIEKYDKLK